MANQKASQRTIAPPRPAEATRRGLIERACGLPAAIVVLAAFYALMMSSVWDKSLTFDESVHALAGCTYWRYNDYRMNPENGNLPQRVAGFPLALGDFRFPSRQQEFWHTSREWDLAAQFFYESGNSAEKMALYGRGAIALLAVALGLVVYLWSRRLFGPGGGMVSLLLYVLCPTVLANGPLMTSDIAASLTFLLSAWALWAMIHRLSLARLALSCLAMAALFLAKMSAPLIIPMALIMMAAKIVNPSPLMVGLGRKVREVTSRARQAGYFAAAILVHAVVVVVLVWAAYGFRYNAMADYQPDRDQMMTKWEDMLQADTLPVKVMQFARAHHVLPEAYLYGYTNVFFLSQGRSAFLDGQISNSGWLSFFPKAFLYKTPLTVMAVLVLACVCAVLAWRAKIKAGGGRGGVVLAAVYRTLPLWALIVIYLAVAVTSHINIGLRHVLPTFAPIFILAGAAGALLANRALRLLVVAPMVLLAAEVAWFWPNYLPYFNQIAGGPSNGWKHLVDSSLDWGQDLPALKRHLDSHKIGPQYGDRLYISYFGMGSPIYYGLAPVKPAPSADGSIAGGLEYLPGFFGLDRQKNWYIPAYQPGVYCISATMIQPLLLGPNGPWDSAKETMHRRCAEGVQAWSSLSEAARKQIMQDPARSDDVVKLLTTYDSLHFQKLCDYLRRRGPDDSVNHTILIFRLSAWDLEQALGRN